jgi:hypothetical protein
LGTSKNADLRRADDALAEPWSQIGHEDAREAPQVFDCAENRR